MRYWGFCFLSLVLLSTSADARSCSLWVAKVISIQGTVELRVTNTNSAKRWTAVKRGNTFCANDVVRVKNNSRAALILTNDTILRLDQNSTITFANISTSKASQLNLLKGVAHFISRVKQAFEVVTPFVNAAVEGTEFVVAVNEAQSQVTVFEGKVRVSNKQGEVLLKQNQSALALKGQAPILKTIIKPRDAVQWALYYPVVVEPKSLDAKAKKQIIAAANKLAKGRVKQALKSLNKVLATSPQQPEALALKAIIALVNNDKDKALTFAKKTIASSPKNISALLAMSYVQQAHFNIQAALDVLSKNQIENALVYARLSELYLMLGDLENALLNAKKAVALNDKLAKTQSVLGFAYLTQIKVKQATATFNKAIELDQTDPLSHLGLGLALIRQGKLENGRREIEYAASLDPNNALIRSYLGKAYYEEKRNKVAASQFEMAKALDPKDPTAWFYDAIQKQSENRPIEALTSLENAIKLNDNRAVYRSSLLLDQDEAARSASQARIYNDVGFSQLALQEGWKSLSSDPSNSAAHRFLSDTYSNLPRHQIARVSELLQAQLLQPLNSNPIQPQLAVANLGILDGTGPSNASYSEFNPLFSQNGIRTQVNVIGGSNNTVGNDLVVSSLSDNIAFSVGQFHYETDGFRVNNDIKQDIGNVFMQAALSPNTSIQAEYLYHDSEYGDLEYKFDLTSFFATQRNKRKRSTSRLGINHKLNSNNTFLASFIYNDLVVRKQENTTKITSSPPFTLINEISLSTKYDSEAFSAELQNQITKHNVNYTVGFGVYDENRTESFLNTDTLVSITPTIPGFPFPPASITSSDDIIDARYNNAYFYSQLKFSNQYHLTIGLSYDDVKISTYDRSELNPKLGLTWKDNKGSVFRLAYFEGVGRPENAEHTIEPTLVAGFNQFFDDNAGSKTKRYGLAYEQKFSSGLSSGIELSWRDLLSPILNSGGGFSIDDRDEEFHRIYLYWTATNQLSLTAEYFLEKESGQKVEPKNFKSQTIPLGLNYFWLNGITIGLTASYIDQKVVRTSTQEEDDFWLSDIILGYRLAGRKGLFQLIVKNLANQKFNYFDTSNNSLARGPRGAQFVPERQIFARFSLSF